MKFYLIISTQILFSLAESKDKRTKAQCKSTLGSVDQVMLKCDGLVQYCKGKNGENSTKIWEVFGPYGEFESCTCKDRTKVNWTDLDRTNITTPDFLYRSAANRIIRTWQVFLDALRCHKGNNIFESMEMCGSFSVKEDKPSAKYLNMYIKFEIGNGAFTCTCKKDKVYNFRRWKDIIKCEGVTCNRDDKSNFIAPSSSELLQKSAETFKALYTKEFTEVASKQVKQFMDLVTECDYWFRMKLPMKSCIPSM